MIDCCRGGVASFCSQLDRISYGVDVCMSLRGCYVVRLSVSVFG